MSAFLRYVVEETLAGRADRLKGYTIATEALGRPDDFDPGNDASVRVLATRVRRALEVEAAREPGAPWHITMPPGRYVAVFTRGATAPAAATGPASASPLRPTRSQPRRHLWRIGVGASLAAVVLAVAVLALVTPQRPEAPETGPSLPSTLSHERVLITTSSLPALARVPVTVEAEPALQAAAQRLADKLARFDDLLMVVRPRAPGAFRGFRIELAPLPGPGERMFAVRVTAEPGGRSLFQRDLPLVADQPSRETLAALATELAQPYGVFWAEAPQTLAITEADETVRSCQQQYFEYFRSFHRERFDDALACVNSLLQRPSAPAVAHAVRAILLVEGYRLRLPRFDRSVLDEALAAAERAVALAPASARARQARVAVLFVRGAAQEGLADARRAVELNPYDLDVLADLGARLIQVGQNAEGLALLERTEALAAAGTPWRWFFLAVGRLLADDRWGSASAAERIAADDFGPGLAMRIIAAHTLGDGALASTLAASLRRRASWVSHGATFEDELLRRGFASGVAETLHRALEAALPPA